MAKKKFYGSLVRRVILICLVLIVAPLIFYSVLIWNRDWKLTLNTVFSQFELVGDSSKTLFDQWHSFRLTQLENFTKELGDQSISTKFIFDESFTCSFSTKQEMEGKGAFFTSQLEEASQLGSLVFSGVNPFTNREEIFIVKRLDNEIRGLSVYADTWLAQFAPDSRFIPSIITPSNLLIFSTEPRFDQSVVKQFSLSKLKEEEGKAGFLEARALRNRPLAIVIPFSKTTFLLQIGLSQEQVSLMEGESLFHHLLAIFACIIVVGGVGTWWLTKRMARSLNQLAHIMDGVKAQEYEGRYREDRYGFEINTLGNNFNQMLDTLLLNMEEAKNQRVAREILFRELQIGHDVQKQLLPRTVPQFSNIEFGLGFVPAKEVAGDFYDLFFIDEEHMMLAIADGSDKGISACLYSLIVRSMLRGHAKAKEELSEVVLQSNNLFCEDTGDTGNFVTVWVGFYHVEDRQLTYSCAGHLPAILLHQNGEIEELTTAGIALGADVIGHVEVQTVNLPSGSYLFLYTDGILEAHNEKGELFGKSRLFEFLKASPALQPQDLVDQLIAEVGRFCQDAPQHDDLTLLCVKVH